jgi:hypothetical protein
MEARYSSEILVKLQRISRQYIQESSIIRFSCAFLITGLKLLIVTKSFSCPDIPAMNDVALIVLGSKNCPEKGKGKKEKKMCVVIAAALRK